MAGCYRREGEGVDPWFGAQADHLPTVGLRSRVYEAWWLKQRLGDMMRDYLITHSGSDEEQPKVEEPDH